MNRNDLMSIEWSLGGFFITENSPVLPIESGPFYITVNGQGGSKLFRLEVQNGLLTVNSCAEKIYPVPMENIPDPPPVSALNEVDIEPKIEPTIKVEADGQNSDVDSGPFVVATSSLATDDAGVKKKRGRKCKTESTTSQKKPRKSPTTTTVNETEKIKTILHSIDNKIMKKFSINIQKDWAVLWKMTDERPDYCEFFIQQKGIDLVFRCFHAFPGKRELFQNMTGVLMNISEVENLRPHLMTPKFIEVCNDLLNPTEKLQTTYGFNAAGILVNLLADGVDHWTITTQRSSIQTAVRRNLLEWSVKFRTEVEFKSLGVLFKLFKVEHTIECQLWAAWTLAYLTTVNPKKYVKMLKDEDRLEMLRETFLKCSEAKTCDYLEMAIDIVFDKVQKK